MTVVSTFCHAFESTAFAVVSTLVILQHLDHPRWTENTESELIAPSLIYLNLVIERPWTVAKHVKHWFFRFYNG